MTKSLDGRIALVTGGSRGIGRAIALRLARDGCSVVAFTYHADESAARHSVSEIEGAGADAIAIRAGLDHPDQIAVLFRALDEELSDLTGDIQFDILVIDAGTGGTRSRGTLASATPEEFDRAFATEVRSPFFVIQAAADRLRDGGRVAIVSPPPANATDKAADAVASMAGAAIKAMTEIAATELEKRGITVNSVTHGKGETDIAGAVSLLVSPAAAWLTGQHIDA